MLSIKSFGLRVAATAITLLLVLPALAQDTVMFNYQGRVKVEGRDFDGTGQFKFAILSPDKTVTLWSNDSTSNNGGEPTSAVSLEVSDGVFNVLMGANGITDEINSTIFQSKSPLKLRTWFNDGAHGFQALHPDHNLININLITSQTGRDSFTIYVNGTTGNDSHSGLRPNRAKKTIQAAVDIVPSRVIADVTIKVADGTYAEKVQLYGISCKPGKSLTLEGDSNWNPAKGGNPAVIITGNGGTESDDFGVQAVQCTGLKFSGITFKGCASDGLKLEDGKYDVSNCVARNNSGCGFNFANQVRAEAKNIVALDNATMGIAINVSTRCNLTSPTAVGNNYGLFVGDNSACGLHNTGNFSGNRSNGIHCIAFSAVAFELNYSNGKIENNKDYGAVAGWNSYFHLLNGKNIYSGNLKGNTYTFNGGQLGY